MADRVVFHVGLPKAGTTFVQTIMWHNRARLRDEQGFLYPGDDRMDHFEASQDLRQERSKFAGAWERMADQARAWPGTVMISHEFFSMASAEQAKRAVADLAPAEVVVVVTARDYVRQFPAMWQEFVKIGTDDGLDDYMDKALDHAISGAWSWESQELPAVLARWAGAVGEDHVVLVTLPPAGAPRTTLWERWVEAAGIDAAHLDTDVNFGNESLGAPQAALMRLVSSHVRPPLTKPRTRHRWVRHYFGHEVLVPQKGARFGLRPHHADRLRELGRQAVDEIAGHDYRVVGDLQDLVPPDDLPTLPHPDDVTDAEMLEVAGQAIVAMIDDVRRLSQQRNRLREELEARPPSLRSALTKARRLVRRRLRR